MKKFFSTALLVLMTLALLLCTTGCGSQEADEAAARIAQLEEENAQLKAQLDALTAQIDSGALEISLEDWSLEAHAWSDGNGATVTFTAVPANYMDGQRAALSVRMGTLEAESTNCVWDGSAFVGSVELSAADGYSYYCILTGLDGSQQEIALNSPENTTDEMLVYLGTSLTAYANLIVEDWAATTTALDINSGYIQAQMPRMTHGDKAATVSSASLVLKLNEEEVDRKSVTLTAGEGENSYETAISDFSFTMPAMEEDHQLDLWLELTLSNGSIVTASGGSWYCSDGELQLAVG